MFFYNQVTAMDAFIASWDSKMFYDYARPYALVNLGDTVVIEFPTFTETAVMAGQSRVMGGYHIQADNVAGLELGRDVADEVWTFYLKHTGESADDKRMSSK